MNRALISEPRFPPRITTILGPPKTGTVFRGVLKDETPLPNTLVDRRPTLGRAIHPASEFACGCGAVAPRSNGLTNKSPTASELPEFTRNLQHLSGVVFRVEECIKLGSSGCRGFEVR